MVELNWVAYIMQCTVTINSLSSTSQQLTKNTKFKWIFIHGKSKWVTTTIVPKTIIWRKKKNNNNKKINIKHSNFFSRLCRCCCCSLSLFLCRCLCFWLIFSFFSFTFLNFHSLALRNSEHSIERLFRHNNTQFSCNIHSQGPSILISTLLFFAFSFFSIFSCFFSFSLSFFLFPFHPSRWNVVCLCVIFVLRKNSSTTIKRKKQRVIFWLFSSQTVNMVGCILVNHWVCTMWQFLWSFQAEIIPFSSVIV